MSVHLLIDFGSTYTKVIAVDIEKEIVIGRAQAPTTVDTDVTIGLNNALSNLFKTYGIDKTQIQDSYASSSAAGGLKMAAIGLVPELTLEAARRAALGAGAKVTCSYGFEINKQIVHEIESAKCDMILLCGGTDGGDQNVIVHNARLLAQSNIKSPILVAGNRAVTSQLSIILEEAGKKVYSAKNVLPSLDILDVEPAQKKIREIFIDHITKAKGLDKAQYLLGDVIIPTPKATLQAATLLADGTKNEPGIGSVIVVEVGGATTNIHSVIDNLPVTYQAIVKGLPETRIKRSVEGDLGIRYNAPTIYDHVGNEGFLAKLKTLVPSLDGEQIDITNYVREISNNVGYVPANDIEYNLDIALAGFATSMAVQRHAGTVKKEWTVVGEVVVQHGKNFLKTENVIGTGGIFMYGLHPERVLRSALFSAETPWSLKPQEPKAYLDSNYILYGIGLLAEKYPDQALRIAKKYLQPTVL